MTTNYKTIEINETSTAKRLADLVLSEEEQKKVEILDFHKIYHTWDEVAQSEEYNRIWEGWQGKESAMRVYREFELEFAFVTKVEPKSNYGRDFRMFRVYNTNGLRAIKEFTVHSCLHNGGLRRVSLYEDSALFGVTYYRKDAEARKILREMCARDKGLALE